MKARKGVIFYSIGSNYIYAKPVFVFILYYFLYNVKLLGMLQTGKIYTFL